MSIIETAPQKSKEYNKRPQDHGDAAQYKHFNRYKPYRTLDEQRMAFAKRDQESFNAGLKDTAGDYLSMTPAQLEAEADKILDEKALVFSTATLPENSLIVEEDDDDVIDYDNDGFLTEADFGIKSKHEIGREMARRVTLDPDYDEDDTGDNDYTSPIHIRNRL